MTSVTIDADSPNPIGFHTIHPPAEDNPRGIGFHTLARKKVGEKEADSNGGEKLNVFHGGSD